MKYVKFGKSEVIVSSICFGCSELWHDDKELIQEAFNLGVTFFDLANIYGQGKSEEMVGSVVKPFRKKVVLATKVGMNWKTYEPEGGEEYIIKSCEESLKRLQTDYIDLYQAHCFNSSETTSILKKLQSQGKILHFGVSNYNSYQLSSDPCIDGIVSNQIRFNFLQQDVYHDVTPVCYNNNISVMAYSPLCKGLMTGKFIGDEQFLQDDIRYKDPMFLGDAFRNNIHKVQVFLDENKVGQETSIQTVLRWITEKGVIPVVGSRTTAQLKENVKIT